MIVYSEDLDYTARFIWFFLNLFMNVLNQCFWVKDFQWRDRSLSESINNIICAPKMNKFLTGLEWHEGAPSDRPLIPGWTNPLTQG